MKNKITDINLIVLLSLLLLLGCVIAKVYIAFSYSTDLGGVEEATFYNIHKIFVHGTLYNEAPDQFPYTITPHTPLYYYLITNISRLFFKGTQQEMHILYVFGRLLSLFFVCTAMVFFYRSLKNLAVNNRFSAGLTLFAFASLDNHVFSMRPDGLKLLVSCIYLYYAVKYLKKPAMKYLLLSAIIVATGFFVKQDTLLISAVLSLILLINRRVKLFFYYNIFILLLLVLGNFILYLVEPYYFSNVFLALVEFKSMTLFIVIFHIYLINRYYYIILLSVLLMNFKTPPGSVTKPLIISVLTLFLFSIITSNKWGSSTTYYTDFQLLSILSTGYIMTYWKNKNYKSAYVLMLCIFALRSFYSSNSNYIKEIETERTKFREKTILAKYISTHFKTKPGEFYFCLDPSFNVFLPENQLLGAIHVNNLWVYAKYKYKMEGNVKTPFSSEGFFKYLNSTTVPYVIINNDEYVISSFLKIYTSRHIEVFRNNNFIVYKNL